MVTVKPKAELLPLYRYVFEEYCKDADIPLGDETQKIFLNTKGTREVNVQQELIHFLHYVENGEGATVEGFEELLMDSKAEGKKEDIIELLKEVGEVSEDLQSRIRRQWKLETLSLWLKLAAKAESIEEFESKIQ